MTKLTIYIRGYSRCSGELTGTAIGPSGDLEAPSKIPFAVSRVKATEILRRHLDGLECTLKDRTGNRTGTFLSAINREIYRKNLAALDACSQMPPE